MSNQLYRRLFGKPSPTAAPTGTAKLPSAPLRRFTYGQLRRATSDFAPSRKLGQGGFGPVFRGLLPSGREVAVKVMDSCGSLQGDREFHNELALAARLLPLPSPDRRSVVVPFGYCFDEGGGGGGGENTCLRWWKRKVKAATGDDSDSDDDGGLRRRGRVMLVYDLMHHGSVQDALLDRRCPELVLEWACRFAVAVDIARGLRFLHAVCDPPVVHGDIKPSNILLDSDLSAKIADFGLAHVLADDTPEDVATAAAAAVVVVDTIEPVEKKEKNKDLVVPLGGEEDAASSLVLMAETEESITTAGFEGTGAAPDATNGIVMAEKSPDIQDDEGIGKSLEGDELTSTSMDVASTSEANGGYDRMSVDSARETGASSSRKGAWKKSGGGGMFYGKTVFGGGGKDYVMEWIKSEIKERQERNWTAASKPDCSMRTVGRLDRKKVQRRSEWWSNLDEDGQIKKKKNRPAREWWREEFCEELTKKQEKKRTTSATSQTSTSGGDERHWWEKDENCALPPQRKKKKNWSRSNHGGKERGMDDLSGEIWTSGVGRRSSRDWAGGGEVPKSGGTVSSTPSMRGTVCYVAPEYGGGGPPSEKCDIYSFGVLLLVLISGRRPLQVIASPISEFERANLISWARHLARSRRLLDLVDPALREMDTDQVLLCIKVALLCIQRSPARRPSIVEIIGMLTGQSEPPHLPMEFSPSPPGGYSFKSRKKTR
ncbi:uncharacterized protein M6B38_400260 [Iris pallida]|uniref:non-specific serine/threonine protein kinase n=1 Tax=Iris pallida TaxID=29817 RepID=A0AAX6FU03_IRIPA|nr:uncharacterized protein M6B38_400260 [Iris pallida]